MNFHPKNHFKVTVDLKIKSRTPLGDRPKAVYIPPLGLYIYYIGHMAIYKTSKFGKNHNFWNKIQQKLVVDQSRKGISTIGKHPK